MGSQAVADADGIPGVIYGLKAQKSIQFSAMSTMMANMGQANYVAANSMLDKFVSFERPQIDAVTLMWGAVGAIGMRQKAFGDKDVLNAHPEALLTLHDASKVLHVTAVTMGVPEWYGASFYDDWTRKAVLT